MVIPSNPNRPLSISVAMGTCNGNRFLQEQLTSIANQEILPKELVVCDDVSTDDTIQIISEFARTASFEVRFIQNGSRLGIAKNFEKAISLCSGDIIALADQDDVWNPRKLARVVQEFDRNPEFGGLFSDAELIDASSVPMGRRLWASVPFRPRREKMDSAEFARLLLRQTVATAPTIAFRSELRDLLLPIPQTWMQDAWIIWMLALHSSVGCISEPLIQYRIHAAQGMGVPSRSPLDRIRMIRRVGEEPYCALIKRLGHVREHLQEHPEPRLPGYIQALDEKIRLTRFQTKLAHNRAVRAIQIMTVLPLYARYSRGLVSVCRDLLM
jgi:hypothetical protein